MLETSAIAAYNIGGISRTQNLKERDWNRLTELEKHVQAFIERGVQLPDSVLDEFIAPLFNEQPFTSIGFILVGFPNTPKDFEYLMKNWYFPEAIYVLEVNENILLTI